MKKKRRGAPKKDNPRSIIKPIRFTKTDLEQIQEAADLMKMPLSVYIRAAALSQAQRVNDRIKY